MAMSKDEISIRKQAANWGVRAATNARPHILKALHGLTNDPWFGFPEWPPSSAANQAMARLVTTLNLALEQAKKAEGETRKSGFVTI